MEKNDQHYFYVLECKDGSYYGGYTIDIERRLAQHRNGTGAKYTRGRGPLKLLHYSLYQTIGEALRAESTFKQLSRSKKEKFLAEVDKSDEESKKLS
jgi:putative endonuclease